MEYLLIALMVFILGLILAQILKPLRVCLNVNFKQSMVPSSAVLGAQSIRPNEVNYQNMYKLKTEDFIIERDTYPGLSAIQNLTPKDYSKIDILIPAHNEEYNLSITINSIRRACVQNKIACRIIVGLDFCEDKSIDIASEFADVVVATSYRSKWKTLNHLVKFANAEWVSFVDVGTVWSSDLVAEIQRHQQNEDLMFIAPSYKLIGASTLQGLNWSLECFLKTFENKIGGPITVHGATVCYRLNYLQQTLDYLSAKDEWLNDDVIIPLTMRALYPHNRGLYLSNVAVLDLPSKKYAQGRRNRISFGNLQVLEFVENNYIALDTNLKILWYRRKYRIFWAYFLGLGILSSILILPGDSFLNLGLGLSAISMLLISKAFRASISAPLTLLKIRVKKTTVTNVKWE